MQLSKLGQMHIFVHFFFAYFCIFILMHILAYNAYQDIYLGYYAYFRNANLCILSFAYFCIFFCIYMHIIVFMICIFLYIIAYKHIFCIFHLCILCIFFACLVLHVFAYFGLQFLHLDAYYAHIFWVDNSYWEHTTGCEACDDEASAWEFLLLFAGRIAAEATRWWLGCGEGSQEQRGAELILRCWLRRQLGPLREMLYNSVSCTVAKYLHNFFAYKHLVKPWQYPPRLHMLVYILASLGSIHRGSVRYSMIPTEARLSISYQALVVSTWPLGASTTVITSGLAKKARTLYIRLSGVAIGGMRNGNIKELVFYGSSADSNC